MCHDRESEHRRKSKEGTEAEYLAEHAQGAFAVVADACQYRLCHAAHHSCNKLMPRGVPFIGLVIIAHRLWVEVFSQYDRKQVVVQLVGDIGDEQLAAESEERLQRAEINPERRAPRREVPAAYRHDNQVRKALCGDAPVGKSVVGKRDAQTSR